MRLTMVAKIPTAAKSMITSDDYLEGQGDLVGILITPITHIINLGIPVINLVTESP